MSLQIFPVENVLSEECVCLCRVLQCQQVQFLNLGLEFDVIFGGIQGCLFDLSVLDDLEALVSELESFFEIVCCCIVCSGYFVSD